MVNVTKKSDNVTQRDRLTPLREASRNNNSSVTSNTERYDKVEKLNEEMVKFEKKMAKA